MKETVKLLDIDVLPKIEYFHDEAFRHLIHGIWWFEPYRHIQTTLADVYNMIVAMLKEQKSKPLPLRKAIVRSWSHELSIVIGILKEIEKKNEGKEVMVYAPYDVEPLDAMIAFYQFEIDALTEALASNLDLEYDKSLQSENEESPYYNYPLSSLANDFEMVLCEYAEEWGRSEVDDHILSEEPIEHIIYSEMRRRAFPSELPIETSTREEYRAWRLGENANKVQEAIVEKKQIEKKLDDKTRACILYYMLADALKFDRTNLLAKVISFVNNKEFDEKKASNSSAYNYVHHPDKFTPKNIEVMVNQLKRYNLTELLKKHLKTEQLKQYGIE